MRLVVAGTPEVALPSLDALRSSEHEVCAVVTRPDAPSGRGRTRHPSPVKARALEQGLEVLTPTRMDEPTFLARLRELAPDACPVIAYGALLPPEVIAIPEHGWINLHFSLLPAWRGAAPVQHAIIAGDSVTGASTFRIERGLDSGPVFGTLTEVIGASDTAGSLLSRLAHAGAGLLLATLDAIADGSARPVPQPEDGVSLAPKLASADAQVVWSHPAFAVDRRVRGCTPAPGAWTTFRGQRLGLGPLRPDPGGPGGDLAAGQVAASKQEVWVGTATDAVRLGSVRPVGKREMPAADWARGMRIETGEVLGG